MTTLREAVQEYLSMRRALLPQSGPGADVLFVYDQRTYLPPLLQRQDRVAGNQQRPVLVPAGFAVHPGAVGPLLLAEHLDQFLAPVVLDAPPIGDNVLSPGA